MSNLLVGTLVVLAVEGGNFHHFGLPRPSYNQFYSLTTIVFIDFRKKKSEALKSGPQRQRDSKYCFLNVSQPQVNDCNRKYDYPTNRSEISTNSS